MRLSALLILLLSISAWAADIKPPAAPPVATLTAMWNETQFTGIEEVETEILRLTNDARAGQRLPALSPDTRLRTAAQQHSLEMSNKNYFEHNSPEVNWHSPAQRCYLAGFWGQLTGENIASIQIGGIMTPACEQFPTPQAVAQRLVENWLNSPPHRKNIMDKDYKLLGVGVTLKDDQVVATQEFGKELTIIEKATLTPYTGEQIVVDFKIKATIGAEIKLWVKQSCRQTIIAPSKEFTVSTLLPSHAGTIPCVFSVGNKAAFQTLVNTDLPLPTVKLDTYFADPAISFQKGSVSVEPVTGLKLKVTGHVPPGQGAVAITNYNEMLLNLSPDNTDKMDFTLELPQSNKPYRIGFFRGNIGEYLLFVDTSKPLIEMFQGRPLE